MKKNIKLLIIFILGLFFIIPSAYAIEVSKDDILYNSYVIGTYLYTTDENDIYNTTGLDTIYNENNGLFTKEIMLAATSITKMEYEDMIIYYKDFWDEWGDALTGKSIETEDAFEITHVNGICIDPSCSGNKVTVTLKYNNETDSDVTKSVAYGTVFGKPEAPTRLGYKFVCWEISDGQCYDFNQEITDNIVLSAKWEVYSYKVTFVNSVNESDTRIVTCDFASADQCSYSDFESVFSAVPEGYTFMGWSTAKTGEKVYTSSNYTDLFGDATEITLYAIFSSGTSKISYQLNGGTFNTVVSPVTTYDPSIMTYSLLSPIKEGYTFKGWSVVSGDAVVSGNTLTINTFGNITLEAQWETHTYTLVYNGKTLASCSYDVYCSIDESVLNIPEGKELTKLEVESSDGNYIEIGSKVKNLTTENNAKLNVRATIEDITYNVYYDYNGGSVSDSNVNKVKLNSETNLNVPTRTGYAFNGWKVSDGATIDGNKLTLNSPKDIYIETLWTPNTYTLKYNEEDYITCTYDNECTIPDLTNEKIEDGNVFNGWYILKGDDKVYLGSSVTNLASSGAVTIYADISPIKYSVSYEYNGGIVNTANDTKISVGSTIDLIVPTKTGYTFKEWVVSDGATINGDAVNGYKLTLNSASDVSVTAIWTANIYKLMYNGKAYASCEYDKECSVSSLEEINVPSGRKFLRWKDSNGNVIGDVVYNLSTNGDVDIEPEYLLTEYSISYNYGGGRVSANNPASYNVDKTTIELSEPTKVGYTFIGWDVNTSVASIEGNTLTINVMQNISVTANWQVNKYTIVYDETDIPNMVCAYGDTCVLSDKVPTKEGYSFGGWLYNSYLFKEGETINLDVTGNVELKAYWLEKKADKYSINYVLDGGTFVNSPITIYTAGTGVDSLTEPTKTGYQFLGWFDKDDLDVGKVVSNISSDTTGDVTLYAKWKANKYSINLYADEEGNNILKTIECVYDVDDCNLGDNSSSFDGYTLYGWSKNPSGNLFYGDNLNLKNVIDSDTLNLYPVLEVNTYVVSYYLDGGSFTDSSSLLSTTYANGDSLSLPEVSRAGYSLNGWKLSDGTTITDGQNNLTGDIVLIPVWDKINKFTINFYPGFDTDQTMDSIECTFGEECILPANEFDRGEDYYLLNWEWNNSEYLEDTIIGIPTFYKDGAEVNYSWETAAKNNCYEINLTAQWIHTYKVSYTWYYNMWNQGNDVLTVNEGASLSNLPKFVNGGTDSYKVVRWEDASGNTIDLNTYRVNSDISLTAIVEERTTYTVTYTCYYNMWSQCPSGSVSVYEDELITGLPQSFDGYDGSENREVFITKWKISDTGVVIDLNTYTVTSNITIEAAEFN